MDRKTEEDDDMSYGKPHARGDGPVVMPAIPSAQSVNPTHVGMDRNLPFMPSSGAP